MSTGNGSKELRRYDLRDERGHWLGRIVISDDGYFSTVSDYGNYAYWWGHAGECFRRFLCGVDADYLVRKIAPQKVYDGDKTEKAIRLRILEWRREGILSREEAREEWDLIGEKDVSDREGFAFWWEETKLEDASELSEYVHEPQAVAFAERVWPALVKAIRTEMSAEKAA